MPLGIGIIGSGFNARFHLQAFVGVRDADIRGVWSPNRTNARSAAALARPIESSPAFARLSFRAPVTRDPTTQRERFQFAIELARPKP